MRRSTATLCLLLLAALAPLQGCGDAAEPLPAVSWIEVAPADTLLAPGDSLRFTARAFAADGAALDAVPLTFELAPGSVGELAEDGLFRATGEGEAHVVVREPRVVRAFARVRTSAVTGFEPPHAPFGGLITLHGAGFDAATEVRFGDVAGTVRRVAEDGRSLEAWVPWDAGVATVSALLDGTRAVAAPGTFFLTGGGDDALEPNHFERSVSLPLPFRNPYLLTRWDDMDHVAFEVTRPGPVTVRVSDHGEGDAWADRVVLQLNRGDATEEFVGLASARDWVAGRRADAVIARATLAPGRYTARIFVPEARQRRYALRVDTVADFAAAPDAWESNDFPAEAPAVTLPFADTLALENGWGMDYFTLHVSERSQVEVTARSMGPRLALFLIDGERSVHWHLAGGTRARTWRGAIGPEPVQSLACRVEAGTYHVAVLENGGEAGRYALDITATPRSDGFLNCVTGPIDEAPLLRAAPGAR